MRKLTSRTAVQANITNGLALGAVGDKEHLNDCQHDILKYEEVSV
jgi:hypothetical protein